MAPTRAKTSMQRADAVAKYFQPYGFSKSTILKVVNRLLENYGGEYAWKFIEENSYNLVMETILTDQEKEAIEKKEEKSETKIDVPTICNKNVETEAGLSIICNQDDETKAGVSTICSQNANLTVEEGINWMYAISDARRADEPQVRRRPPCYGWISESESEDESDDTLAKGEKPVIKLYKFRE